MRTTVTLDPDVDQLVKRAMRERKISFKAAVNDAIRFGLSPASRRRIETPTFKMGKPLVDLTKALQLVGELEDAEILKKMARGV